MVVIEVTGPATFNVPLADNGINTVTIDIVERGISDPYISKYQVYIPPGKGEVTVHLSETARYQIRVTGERPPKEPKEKIAA